jgi:predicted nuclease with TOPRIM domain
MEDWGMGEAVSFLKNKYVIGFGAGLAAAIAGYRVYKSKKIRKALVKAVACGIKLREDAKYALNSIKEDAEDVCAEAKEQGSAAETAGV